MLIHQWPQYAIASAIPNNQYQIPTGYNTFLMHNQQTILQPQLTKPPSTTIQLAGHTVLENASFMSNPSVGTNLTSGNQQDKFNQIQPSQRTLEIQPTQSTQPPANTRTTSSVDGSQQLNCNTRNGNKDDQQHCDLTATAGNPDSQTQTSAETIVTQEECNLGEMPTSTSESVIFSSRDAQTDASLFKETNRQPWTPMEYQNKAFQPFRAYEPFTTEPTTPCVDNISDVYDSLD